MGKTLRAVTLDRGGEALSGNYLRIALATPREANRLEEVRIGAVTPRGLAEYDPLAVLHSVHVHGEPLRR